MSHSSRSQTVEPHHSPEVRHGPEKLTMLPRTPCCISTVFALTAVGQPDISRTFAGRAGRNILSAILGFEGLGFSAINFPRLDDPDRVLLITSNFFRAIPSGR